MVVVGRVGLVVRVPEFEPAKFLTPHSSNSQATRIEAIQLIDCV
jgi:hypothetical protein